MATMEGMAMKFEYDVSTEKGRPLAILYEFNNEEDRQCLAIRALSGEVIWFYDTGLPSIQGSDLPETDIIRKFYPGDKITITF